MAERREILLDIQARTGEAEKRLQEITVQLADNRKSLRELNKEYNAGRIEADEYGKSVAELTVENKELGAEQRSLQRQIINTTKATEAAEGSNEQLRAQLSLLTQEYNGLGEDIRETSQRGQALKEVTREISDELKENESAVGDNRRNVGNYASALDGLGGALDRVLPGFSGIISGAKEGSGQLQGIGASAGKLGGIAGRLGKILGGPLVAGLLAVVGAGVKAAEAIVNVTREFDPLRRQVNQLTGAEGDSLNALTGQVQGLAETFGADFNDVLRAANSAAVQFGIPIEEALDQIGEGFINGANTSGQYLDVLQEYPAQLASVGLSLEEANALLIQQEQQGIFSDKGVDAIKEAGIRLRELTPATRDALDGIGLASDEIQEGLETGSVELFDVIQQVSGRLGELEDNSPEVGAAIADIFGGPGEDAGLNYLKLLGDIDGDIEGVSRTSEEFADRQRDQLSLTQRLSTAQSELAANFAPVVSAFDRFGDFVLLKVVQGFNAIVEFITVTIPAGFRGFLAAVGAARQGLEDFVNTTVLDIRIAAKEVENFFSFSDTVERELEDLKSQRAAISEAGTSVGEAFSEAYNKSVEENTVDVAAVVSEGAGPSGTGLGNGVDRQAAAEEEARRLEEIRKQQERDEVEAERRRIENLKNGIEERIAEEQLGLIRIQENRLLSEERRIELTAEREKRLAELRKEISLIGVEEASSEYKLIVAQTAQEIAQIERESRDEVLQIRLDAREKEENEIQRRLEAEKMAADEEIRLANEVFMNQQRLLVEEEKARAAATEMDRIRREQGLSLAQQTFSQAASLLGEQSALGKAAAVAAATISTYQAAAQALSNPPGPPFTIPLAAIAVAAGLRQVREIVSVETPGFAEGGETGGGFMSDPSIPGRRIAGVVHDNEYVVPSNVLRNPVGRSLVGGLERIRRNGSFADGGFTGVRMAADQAQAAMNTGNQLTQAIENLPNPVVEVREITDTQNRVSVKENTGRL